MKTTIKAAPKRAARRDLFVELNEGVAALVQAGHGQRILRTHALEYNPAPKVTPKN
jgi:hypothetical protein